MDPANVKDLAQAALRVALKLYVRNYPEEAITQVLRSRLLEKINDLIEAGMTDREFLASFSINRVRHCERN